MNLTEDRRIVFVLASFGLLALVMGPRCRAMVLGPRATRDHSGAPRAIGYPRARTGEYTDPDRFQWWRP